MIKNERFYPKRFSRDFTLSSVEAWIRGESANIKAWSDENHLFLPYIIAQRIDDTVHFYYDENGVRWMQNFLVKRAHEDKHFLKQIENNVLSKLSFIRPIYEEEKVLEFDKFKRFLKELEDAYTYCEPMWWFFEMDDEKMVANLDLADLAKVRELTNTLCNGCDSVIRKSLRKIYPQLGELSSVLLVEEIISKKFPDINTLEKRDQGYFYGNGNLLVNIDRSEAAKNFGIKFEKEILPKTRVLNGMSAYHGIVRGFVKRIMGHKQINQIHDGEILISPMTIPDFLPAMRKAAAIVTDEGGILSHAAIIAREFRKPTVVGTDIASKRLKDNDIIEVNATEGKVRLICHASIIANTLKKPCIVGTRFATNIFEDGDYIEVDADKGIITLLNKKDKIKRFKKNLSWNSLFQET